MMMEDIEKGVETAELWVERLRIAAVDHYSRNHIADQDLRIQKKNSEYVKQALINAKIDTTSVKSEPSVSSKLLIKLIFARKSCKICHKSTFAHNWRILSLLNQSIFSSWTDFMIFLQGDSIFLQIILRIAAVK